MTIRLPTPYTHQSAKNIQTSALVELGEIQKLTCGDGADHFDADTSPHYHFVCRDCGQVYDLPLKTLDNINQLAQEYADGHVDSHTIFFYGTCKNCLEKNLQ